MVFARSSGSRTADKSQSNRSRIVVVTIPLQFQVAPPPFPRFGSCINSCCSKIQNLLVPRLTRLAVLEYVRPLNECCCFSVQTMDTMEEDGDLVYLYQLIDGVTSNSHALYTAMRAGIPHDILDRVKQVLNSPTHRPLLFLGHFTLYTRCMVRTNVAVNFCR